MPAEKPRLEPVRCLLMKCFSRKCATSTEYGLRKTPSIAADNAKRVDNNTTASLFRNQIPRLEASVSRVTPCVRDSMYDLPSILYGEPDEQLCD
jgi:hypothetical protein